MPVEQGLLQGYKEIIIINVIASYLFVQLLEQLPFSDNEDGTTAEPKNDKATLKIDEWISFHGDDDIVELLMSLRIKFLSSFVRRISSDGRAWSQSDDAVVQCLVNVLSEEENTGSRSDSDSSRRSKKTVDYDRGERSMAWGSGYRGSPRGRAGRGYVLHLVLYVYDSLSVTY